MRKLKMRLGDLLVLEGIISEEQLQRALNAQKKSGGKLGNLLVNMGFVTEPQLLQFLSRQLDVPLVDISHQDLDPDLVKLLPESHARRYRALVLSDNGDTLLVGMSDPADLSVVDTIANILPKPVKIAVVKESQLLNAFDLYYRRTEEIASFASELASEQQDDEFQLEAQSDDDNDTAVAKLLQSVFEDAVQMGASDIHIEPGEEHLSIRQRVDGVLQETIFKEKQIAAALVLRLKLMSGLDISEKRLPQDGRAQIKVKGHIIDLRISTMPIQWGESVVMRLLDQSQGILSLDETGMPEGILKRFRRIIHQPHGMVLVTGPTGSGKTTTLYGALTELNQSGVKIITVEDPVEYRLPRINQVQVNPKIDLTFSRVLRTTLRQDPDIIMVGEMRDNETVEIGLRGALTGHLVLSTLHTNDAISSAVRLLDMDAPGYLVASSLRAIVAQRLIRRVCDNCSQDHSLTAEQKVWLESLNVELDGASFKQGKGCPNCHQTGYKGRIGVFELLEMNDTLMQPLKQNDTARFSELASQTPGYQPLWSDALNYARQGITSVDEVLRLVEMVPENGVSHEPPVTSAHGEI
ncbi:Protein transport protein HofB like protein [Saliniradius amylolyticus]|uniref:Protein transport protein HofB like protein n=1 Tax=Saliniradius amylolyticus TaxID=2183582 RepID=A0A2S2DZH9_9ALTE|nr:GspE/PulE family protein [Saliniradius amylolyticus]AWL10786.1 Protein transport protein HofB like protein [Saliniradius amylolyticus]